MKKVISIIFVFLIIVGGLYFVVWQINQNQSADDSDALYGGELELGYPSAGFLISYEPGGGSKTCGYAVINKNLAVTAAHCVDNSDQIYIGKGKFTTNNSELFRVEQATQKDGWVRNKERSQDFAILNFNDNQGYFNNFAEIASPTEGCNYRVVAYGRTEDPDESFTKPRKSAIMCASDIRSDIFIIKGEKGGICFGDSGSPLFYRDTNKLAGVIVSIVLETPNDPDPCAIGNTAIVVRPDSNQALVNDVLRDYTNNTGNLVDVTEGSTIQLNVVNTSLWEKIGLGNLTAEQRLDYTVYILDLIVLATAIVGGIYLFKSNKAKRIRKSREGDYYSM